MSLVCPFLCEGSGLGELILSDRTKRTFKIVRQILEFRAGSNPEIGSAELLVILPTAHIANVDHLFFLSFVFLFI